MSAEMRPGRRENTTKCEQAVQLLLSETPLITQLVYGYYSKGDAADIQQEVIDKITDTIMANDISWIDDFISNEAHRKVLYKSRVIDTLRKKSLLSQLSIAEGKNIEQIRVPQHDPIDLPRQFINRDFSETLKKKIDLLPVGVDRELAHRMLVILDGLLDGKTLKQIGATFDLTESGVLLIYQRAIRRFPHIFGNLPESFAQMRAIIESGEEKRERTQMYKRNEERAQEALPLPRQLLERLEVDKEKDKVEGVDKTKLILMLKYLLNEINMNDLGQEFNGRFRKKLMLIINRLIGMPLLRPLAVLALTKKLSLKGGTTI